MENGRIDETEFGERGEHYDAKTVARWKISGNEGEFEENEG
jgi:hypothetical protein